MTAEVAILNKLGVALAADSAVTISEGNDSRKVFNTADKLFELSRTQAIACMIFSNLQFMQAPLQVLLKDFRNECGECDTVAEASSALLNYLGKFISTSSIEVRSGAVYSTTKSVFELLSQRASQYIERRLSDPGIFVDGEDPRAKVQEVFTEAWDTALNVLERYSDALPDADFLGDFPPRDELQPILDALIDAAEQTPPAELRQRVTDLLAVMLRKASPIETSTGLVVAGYGSKELFPTLEHFELFAPVLGALKYRRVERVDISRHGPRARVMAFAQREMAERFLFGLDASTKDKILHFCKNGVTTIGDYAASLVQFEDAEKAENFRSSVRNAENTFVQALEEAGMETIRHQSTSAVEDMVEFMPKQDLADFAEALVNLSSLQRRVNSGFETVGGPIDVAVISKSEGLVWVKRKHYFPESLNSRFFSRDKGKKS